MHKSYQPTRPAANRLLQKKWDEKYYSEHRLLVIKCEMKRQFDSFNSCRFSFDMKLHKIFVFIFLEIVKYLNYDIEY